MASAESLRSLKKDKGYYEKITERLNIVFEDLSGLGRATVSKNFLKPPTNLSYAQNGSGGAKVFYYRVSALNSKGESLASTMLVVTGALPLTTESLILS